MWSSRHMSFGRDEASENIHMSPYLRESSARLTPPLSYHMDARRNSTASSLSSLGPTTPICGRSPFSEHPLGNVPEVDMCSNEATGSMTMSSSMKAPTSDDTFYDEWSMVPQSMNVEHGMPIRLRETFGSNTPVMQPVINPFNGMGVHTTSSDTPCWDAFSPVTYPNFGSHMVAGHGNLDYAGLPQSEWSMQMQHSQIIQERTMVPSEALLGGEYVQVDTNTDTEMSSYDDVDVQLPPSPQDVVFKQEPDSSAEDNRVKRSIHVSSTGGKTVKREHEPGSLTKKKARKSRSKAINRLNDGRFELWLEDDVEQIPGTKRWRKTNGAPDKPQICQLRNPDGTICGRPFKRQEHLHRHEKTHSGRKDFSCQMCNKKFNRNDNCWEHYWTHVLRPGKKSGRNDKRTLRTVLGYISDPKHIEKLHNKWRKEVGRDYDPEDDHVDETERVHTPRTIRCRL